jgi:hypothetical protein
VTEPKALMDISYILKGRYRVIAKVLQVGANKKFPEGVKAKFVPIDLEINQPRLLIDNHSPFGFHLHTGLPDDKASRLILDVKDFNEAYEEFLKEVERVLDNEE